VAHDLLVEALPARATFIDQKFTARHGTASQVAARGLADSIVNRMKQLRANDGSASGSYVLDNVPGAWRPTGAAGSGCATVSQAATPQWGTVRPFALTSGAQFRRPTLGGFTTYASLLASPYYAGQVQEVQALGRATGSTRTADQTRIAWFWANDLDGTYKPPGQLLEHTKIVAQSKLEDPLAVAQLFARVSISMFDASIAAWDQKYDTPIDLWRPETAIKEAATDGNNATQPDANWKPLSADRNEVNFSPCFPAWVSGHATFAASWAGVMRSTFGDNVTFAATSEDPHSLGTDRTRTYTSFTQAAADNARSRIYLGVHYSFDADDGLATGYAVADHVYANTLTGLICTAQAQCWQ
jgi:hypothetical protein